MVKKEDRMSKVYVDIRDEVIKQLAISLDDNRIHTATHPGRFDEAEMRRLMQRTPSVLTSIMELHDEGEGDESYIDFVSWILYRANNKDKLYDGALAIVGAVIGSIKSLDTCVSFGGGTKIKAECLYTGSLDKLNVTLWAVKWRFQVRDVNKNGKIILPDDLDYFEGYESNLQMREQVTEDIVQLNFRSK